MKWRRQFKREVVENDLASGLRFAILRYGEAHVVKRIASLLFAIAIISVVVGKKANQMCAHVVLK